MKEICMGFSELVWGKLETVMCDSSIRFVFAFGWALWALYAKRQRGQKSDLKSLLETRFELY